METPVNAWYEKRHNIRIPNDKLPVNLKTLTVHFGGNNKNYIVQTIDASVSGIAFRLDKPANTIRDFDLTMRAGDSSFTLKDDLVYVKPVGVNASRISVHFSPQPDLEKYTRQIKDAIHQG